MRAHSSRDSPSHQLPEPSDIAAAAVRLRPHLAPTPLEAIPTLNGSGSRPRRDGTRFLRPRRDGTRYLKLEQTLPTHSFKIRGALNALLAEEDSARESGVVSASSGNHAQALARAAAQLGIRARIHMPANTPQRKQRGVARFGAEAITTARDFDEAEAQARDDARRSGARYLSAYNDRLVIAGAGTIGRELLAQCPQLARVVIPTGGGGLLGGIALAIKSACPRITVVGVNARAAPAMHNALSGQQLPHAPETLADALAGDIEAASLTLPLARRYVDEILLVSEAEIAAALRFSLFELGWLAEGGAVVGLAACLSGAIPDDEQPTAIIISGSNIDRDRLRATLQDD